MALVLTFIPSCASSQFREQNRVVLWMTTLENHRNATNLTDALRPLTDEFRFFVRTREGDGLDKQQTSELLRWDLALHRTGSCTEHRFDDHSITARCHEENDFTRLIDFPGWDATVTWWFDGRGRIFAQLTVPSKHERDFRNWLAPAIPWLREHRPADLDWLYPERKLERSPEAARRWVTVLTEWRAATGRSPIVIQSAEPVSG